MIKEHDLVALLYDLPDGSLLRGDVGTVVYLYESGQTVEVEFVNATGETLAVETLPIAHVKPIDQRRAVLHVNEQLLTEAANSPSSPTHCRSV
jgi:hypothetical protein